MSLDVKVTALSSTTETPVNSGGADKGKPDGVSGSPDGGDVGGRTPGGESGGGGYSNPHTGREPTSSNYMGHGGQTEIGYHGGGQAGDGGDAPNAAAGSDSSDGDEAGAAAWPSPEYDPHKVKAGGRTFSVVETNGVAQAETTGKIGTDAAYEREQASPGSG